MTERGVAAEDVASTFIAQALASFTLEGSAKAAGALLVRTERSPTTCAAGARRRMSEARDGRNTMTRGWP